MSETENWAGDQTTIQRVTTKICYYLKNLTHIDQQRPKDLINKLLIAKGHET